MGSAQSPESADTARTGAESAALLPVDELVAAVASADPGRLAVAAGDATLSYGELIERAGTIAAQLAAAGVTPGDAVGLCLPRSAALVAGALGILRAGGAYVALDPSNPDERLAFMLADAGAVALVTDDRGAARLAGSAPVVIAGMTGPAEAPPERAPRPLPAGGADLAYIVYTSGSTGRPKGVMVEHAGLANLAAWHRRVFAVGPDDRATLIASPGFDASVWETWPYLCAGASLHVPPDELRVAPAALRDWLVAQRITIGFLPTALAEEMIALEWPRDSALRVLLTGGDALHRQPSVDVPFALVNNYGPAEATVVATSGRVAPVAGAASTPSIGRPIDSVTVRIVDAELEDVSPGNAGELLIGGAGVARGYVNHPELTAERFVPDRSAGVDGARLYRTGDLVRLRPDGELEFIGRLDDQVNISGRRIEPGEVSATLDRHPGVRASAVVAVGGGPSQRRLVACVVAADGAAPDEDALRAHLRSSLPEHMVPAEFTWLPELPLTPGGKVDRAALRALLAAAPRTATGAAPSTELERSLAAMVAELLGVAEVGVEEDFFLLGGHSLLGAQLITRIGDRFGVELPLRQLFERPTVAGIAAGVEELLVAEIAGMSEEEAARLAAGLRPDPIASGSR